MLACLEGGVFLLPGRRIALDDGEVSRAFRDSRSTFCIAVRNNPRVFARAIFNSPKKPKPNAPPKC